jgi:dihydropteroate synthase type 2
MHSLQRAGKATREPGKTSGVLERITRFFDERCAVLRNAGIDDGRLILDPGMGFFLGDNPEPSLHTLANIKRLRERYGLAVMVSVSRKSFLGAVTGRAVEERGAATLAAELHAASQGVDYIRTHDVRALVDGLAIIDAIGRNA